jgi:hypothetical protein
MVPMKDRNSFVIFGTIRSYKSHDRDQFQVVISILHNLLFPAHVGQTVLIIILQVKKAEKARRQQQD